MPTSIYLSVIAAITLGYSTASAQDAVTTQTATPMTEAAPAPAAEDTAFDDIGARLAKLDSDVKGLKKLKFGAYIQARYETHQNSWNGIDDQKSGDFKTGSGKPGQPDTFYIRRGRVKTTYKASPWSEGVLSLDAAKGGVTLKDVWVDLKEQWTGTQTLRVGQFNIPYGYEIERSSSEREVPERTRWERAVFANERDRGAGLYGKVGILRYAVAVLNGNGIGDKDADFKGVDNNFAKQVVGRAGIDTGWLKTGVSGSHNTKLIPADDVNPNKQYKEQAAGVYLLYTREIPVLGAFGFMGEYNRGWSGSFSDVLGASKTKAGFHLPERRIKMLGWHALVSQYIGNRNQLVYRIDQFDADLESREKDCNNLKKHAATDNCHLTRTTTHTVAWNFFWDDHIRLTSALEIPRQLAWRDHKDATFTEQVQYKF